jgi:hypothetical protein
LSKDDVCNTCGGTSPDNCPAAFHVVSGIRIWIPGSTFEVRYPINRVRDLGVNEYGTRYVDIYCADGTVDRYIGVECEAEERKN